MIDLLASKSQRGDLNINQAKAYLAKHEWGLAKKAAEMGLSKGKLTDPKGAVSLLNDINQRLGLDKSNREINDP